MLKAPTPGLPARRGHAWRSLCPPLEKGPVRGCLLVSPEPAHLSPRSTSAPPRCADAAAGFVPAKGARRALRLASRSGREKAGGRRSLPCLSPLLCPFCLSFLSLLFLKFLSVFLIHHFLIPSLPYTARRLMESAVIQSSSTGAVISINNYGTGFHLPSS